METISKQQLEGVARIYANNQDASRALGPAFHTFTQLCRRCGIQPPPSWPGQEGVSGSRVSPTAAGPSTASQPAMAMQIFNLNGLIDLHLPRLTDSRSFMEIPRIFGLQNG